MSWFANSLSLSLPSSPRQGRGNNKEEDEEEEGEGEESDVGQHAAAGKGVKEDLSELTKSLTRQLWGVASFLNPPPVLEKSSMSPKAILVPQTDRLTGFHSDLAELRGTVATGISRIHGFDELSKFASSLLPFARDMVGEFSDGEYAVGVTEDVVAFANTIAMHPETWLDFPLADEDEDDDFEMTEAQQEHASAVKHEAATLGALYTELCPDIISNGRFWQIYFVLLHSRLSKQDADLLSTPQIIRFRGLLQQLQDKEVAMGRSPAQSGEEELVAGSLDVGNSSNKQQIVESDMEYITKNLVITDAHSIARQDSLADAQKREQLLETNSAKSAALRLVDDETEVNEWLENSDDEKADGKAAIQGTVPQEQTNAGGMENADEDVSFSDLEDNEEETNQRKGISNDPSPEKELPGDATPGSTSERVEFNDWFTVNEEDVASAVLSP
ncbi:unnamed protein product [Sphagnum balticum]